MDVAKNDWERAVADALSQADHERLALLFAQAQEVWGGQEASRMWLTAVSGFDASAVTG